MKPKRIGPSHVPGSASTDRSTSERLGRRPTNPFAGTGKYGDFAAHGERSVRSGGFVVRYLPQYGLAANANQSEWHTVVLA